jgi:endonuclease/exonuclease/phosphatase family metal-dependent hydrolase
MTQYSSASIGSETFVAVTSNLWGDKAPGERAPALRRFMTTRPPDLLATQELRPWSCDVLDEALDGHARVHDEEEGWRRQSNLWWRTSVFEYLEHGSEDVGILDEHARLFWVRLRFQREPERSLVFSTAHLTWPGHAVERSTGVNQRTPQAVRITEELARIGGEEPVIFAVDINDIAGPNWAFGNAGYLDSFSALHRHSPATHPVVPNSLADEIGTGMSPLASPRKAIDWLFHRGPLTVRSSEVAEFFVGAIAPSDHWPVAATYTLAPAG